MTELKLPQVGFDRFIAYAWVEYALDLAISETNDSERRTVLKNWLQTQMKGIDAARKTYNLLARIWFVNYPETAHLRAEALQMAPEVTQAERMALHWGMCLANFRFFSDAAIIAGRLIRLQGEFTLPVLQQRLLEQRSNQGTIPRSVARIIQSLKDWQVITQSADASYLSCAPLVITHTGLVDFLFAASLQHKEKQAWAMMDVLRFPELFAFDLACNGVYALRNSNLLSIQREGSNQEIITLNRK